MTTKIVAYDMDVLNRGLSAFYKESRVRDMRARKDHAAFLDDLEDVEGVEALLYDLPGGTMEDLDKVVGGVRPLCETLKELGWLPVFCTVITPYEDSTRALKATMDYVGDAGFHVAVKNMLFSSRDLDEAGVSPFIFFDGEEDDTAGLGHLANRLSAAGGIVVEMPKLDEMTAPRVAKFQLRFSDAAGEVGKYAGIGISSRVTVKDYLSKTDERCRDLLAKIKAREPNLKPAFFVVSNKGGVGKSMWARTLLDFLLREFGEFAPEEN